jgi:hypothetical protein
MFTQPTVNQIASAYKGNPEPLNAKVEADKKKNGGIPQDLRQLMAAYDLSQGRQNMGIQQALQIPTNMPTVAENVQERARQALQALMVQQAQEQQRKNGQPNIVPPGIPRPPMQAQGLDSLESNVGEGYAEGGIIGFSLGGDTMGTASLKDQELASQAAELSAEEKKNASIAEKKLELERKARELDYVAPEMAVKVREQIASLTPAPKPATPTDPNFRRKTDPRLIGTSSIAPDVPLITSAPTAKAPAAPRANAGSADNAPMPGGLKDLVSTQATPGGDYLRKMLGQDENALAAAKRALYDKEVGARDLSIFDKTAAELEARKQKLNAPKTGFDATMEYLEQIALGGGRSSFESGALGAARQRQLQLARESKQNELMDKILELGGKKSEAMFAEKKGMFDLTQAEKDRIVKEKTEAAGKLNLSEDETRKLIEQGIQKELDRKANIRAAQISAQDRDNLMSRARALMAADPTKKMTLEQAMQRAAEIGAAGTMESAEVRNRKAYDDAVENLNKDLRYLPIRLDKKNDPKFATLRTEYENKLKELQTRYKVAGQGLNALPTSAQGTGQVKFLGYEK